MSQTMPASADPLAASRSAGDVGTFCRVTVAAPTTRVDLAVPAQVPVAALLPALLRHAGDPAGAGGDGGSSDGGAVHGGWVLRTVDGTTLDPAVSLDAAGVHDGDLLLLQNGWDPASRPLYDDVVELLAEGGVSDRWTSRQTRISCAILGGIAVVGGALLMALATTGTAPALVCLGVAMLLVLSGAALSRSAGDPGAGVVVAALAAPWAVLGAIRLLGGDWGRPHLLLACAAVAVVAALIPPLVGAGEALAGAYGAAAITGAIGGLVAVAGDSSAIRAAAVAGPVALAVTTILPTLALRIARLPRPELAASTDDLVDLPGEVDVRLTQARVAAARRLLTGMTTGCLAVTGVCAVILGGSGAHWAWYLSAVLGVLILARARLFRERGQVLAPLLVAGLVLVTLAVILVRRDVGDVDHLEQIGLPFAAGLAVVFLGCGATAGRRSLSPRAHRLIDAGETLLQLSIVPLVLGVWGVYARIRQL